MAANFCEILTKERIMMSGQLLNNFISIVPWLNMIFYCPFIAISQINKDWDWDKKLKALIC